jgi:hypothetical protein
MKKFWMVLVLGWISYAAQSQDTYYAKLFSQNQTVGSARVQGMGGAYGAVGADISAGAINPAGLGLFRRSELSASVGLNNFTNMGKYAGENTETQKRVRKTGVL